MTAMTNDPSPPGPANQAKPARAKKEPATPPPVPSTRVRFDWTAWQHGPIAAPLQAGAGLAAAAMIGDLTQVAPLWGAGVGVAAAAGITVRAAIRDISPLGLVARSACWLTAGGWMAWALDTSAWAPNVLTALAAGTLAAGLAAPEMADHETRVRVRDREAEAAAAADRARAEFNQTLIERARLWQDRLARVCHVEGIRIVGIEDWDDEVGYTLDCELPAGGTTWQYVGKFAPGMASDAKLAHGCGIEVGPGRDRGHMLIFVTVKDTTAEAMPYPADYSPLTYTEALPVGMHRGGVRGGIELLDEPAMIIARRGSGKTVLLQVINTGLARCPDVLIWHIDLNGAGLSSHWMQPWIDGHIKRPVIDWVAPTVAEALLMVNVAIEVAKGRKNAYRALMQQVDDDKIPISAQVPAIQLVLDEGAEAVAANRGNRELAVALETLISIGRAARVNELLTGLRSTADVIPPAIQAQAGTKIVMRPESQQEVSNALGWEVARTIDASEAPYPGSGLMVSPGVPGARTFRGYLMKPHQIREAAVACEARRPYLDDKSLVFADRRLVGPDGRGGTTDIIPAGAYSNRWGRYKTWLEHQGEEAPAMPAPRTPSDEPDRNQAGQPLPDLKPEHQGLNGMNAAVADMNAALEEGWKRAREIEAERSGEPPAPKSNQEEAARVDSAFDELVAGQTFTADEVLGQILAAAGPDGISVTDIDTEMKRREVASPPSRATLYRRLAERGDVHQPVDGKWAIRPAD